MLVPQLTHAWDLTASEARRLQEELARRVETKDRLPNPIRLVVGVDVAYHTKSAQLVAAAVVLDAVKLTVVETVTAISRATYPYVPGLFSFRELPPLGAALKKLSYRPDLFVCDGHGIAHPRRFGLACHLGLMYDAPAIGCAKTRLVGEFAAPGENRGDWSPLIDGGEPVGRVLRTQGHVNPVFVSPGHRVSLANACDWVLRLAPRVRLPETTRLANQLVNEMRQQVLNINQQEMSA